MFEKRRSLILYAGLAGFVIYYGIQVFRVPWEGDIHMYLAVVHALYLNPWLPGHESIAVEGAYSIFYSPYMVLIAMVGKTLQVSPYRALQIAGVANLMIYAGAIALFFRTFASNPRSPWPPLIFLAVSLLLRSETFAWSSETSHTTMRYIQAYPSFLGWALALISFVLAERIARGTHGRSTLAALTFLIAFLLLSHPLTATWVVGIVGLRGLYAVAVELNLASRRGQIGSSLALRETTMNAGKILATIIVAVGLSLLWPYYSLFLLAGIGGMIKNELFGARPVQIMLAVYVLGFLAAIPAIRAGRHLFWIVALAATTGAWAVFRFADISYGDRYVFFMAFFPQVMIADAASLAIERVWHKAADRNESRLAQITAGMYLIAIEIAILLAPAMQGHWGDLITSPAALWRGEATEQAYYDKWTPLRAALGIGDVVMMPIVRAGNDIAAVTGARVVAVPYAAAVPDFLARKASIELFFSEEASAEARLGELKRWHANKIVLVDPAPNIAAKLEVLFGKPHWRDATMIVYEADPPL